MLPAHSFLGGSSGCPQGVPQSLHTSAPHLPLGHLLTSGPGYPQGLGRTTCSGWHLWSSVTSVQGQHLTQTHDLPDGLGAAEGPPKASAFGRGSLVASRQSHLRPLLRSTLGIFSPALRLTHQPSLRCRRSLTGSRPRQERGLGNDTPWPRHHLLMHFAKSGLFRLSPCFTLVYVWI